MFLLGKPGQKAILSGHWTNGVPDTDVSSTLVGAFRRAKDLLTQLRSAWKDIPDNVAMTMPCFVRLCMR